MTNSELLDALIAAVETIEWMNDCSSPARDEVEAAIDEGRAVIAKYQGKAQENIEYLIAFYLDWLNNWLTPAAMAEHYGVTVGECTALINAGRALHYERAAE